MGIYLSSPFGFIRSYLAEEMVEQDNCLILAYDMRNDYERIRYLKEAMQGVP